MDRVTGKELPELFEAIAAKFEENADMLCEMDSKMGDGDLGLKRLWWAAGDYPYNGRRELFKKAS